MRTRWILVIGDAAMYAVATLLGFWNHGELGSSMGERFLATLVPFAVAWFVTAPWLGAYRRDRTGSLRELWRPALAAVLAAPLGGILRGLWLGGLVVPVFVLVMAGVTAVAVTVWRLIVVMAGRRRS
jgi:hypothetical protein